MNASRTVSTSGMFTGLASGLWAEWESKDLSLFSPASAPILGYMDLRGGDKGQSRRTSSSRSPAKSTSTPQSSDLAPSVKGGIGASAGVGLLCILGVILWLVRRKYIQRSRNEDDETAGRVIPELDPNVIIVEAPQKACLKEIDSGVQRFEVPDNAFPYEKYGDYTPTELEGEWHGHEVDDTSPSSKDDKRTSRSSSIMETPAHFFWFKF